MMCRSILQEDSTVFICVQQQRVRINLDKPERIERKIDNPTITVEDFNTLSLNGQTSQQKIRKDGTELNGTNQSSDLIDL